MFTKDKGSCGEACVVVLAMVPYDSPQIGFTTFITLWFFHPIKSPDLSNKTNNPIIHMILEVSSVDSFVAAPLC